MKKTNISKFIAVGLCICALTGCGASPDEKPDTSNPIVNFPAVMYVDADKAKRGGNLYEPRQDKK